MGEASWVHLPPNRRSHLHWQYEVDADQTFDRSRGFHHMYLSCLPCTSFGKRGVTSLAGPVVPAGVEGVVEE